jgi:hypothetical protein
VSASSGGARELKNMVHDSASDSKKNLLGAAYMGKSNHFTKDFALEAIMDDVFSNIFIK